MGAMLGPITILRSGLDADQSAALKRFVDDLAEVLAAANISGDYFERALCALAGAYHAALVTGKWQVVVALLTETMDGISEEVLPSSRAYQRLRAIVAENVDLLPDEMRRLA